MQIDSHLSDLLISLIKKYNQVELEGIARFELKEVPAKFDDVKACLLPPENKLKVSPPQGSNLFLDLLIKESDFDPEEIEQFSNILINFMSTWTRDGKLEIPGFGEVRKEAESLTLRLDHELIYNPAKYLPEVKPQILPVSEDVSMEPVLRSTFKGELISDNKESSWSSYLIPLTMLLLGIAAVVLVFQCFSESNPIKSSEQMPSELPDSAPDDIEPLVKQDTGQIFTNEFLNSYKDVLTQEIIDEGCKIVVGSFADLENAEVMLNQLQVEGYDAEIQPFDKGSRVVTNFDCATRDLVDYLIEIRIKISDNAWLLQPRYDPFD